MTEIDIRFCDDWPLLSLQTLSIFIDISRIFRITISSSYNFNKNDQNTWLDIVSFLNQARNVSSLTIQCNICVIYNTDYDETTENFYSIFPRHIKHLQISIIDMKQISTILERCENLITIRFNSNSIELERRIIDWFPNNTINSTCVLDYPYVCVWLGKEHVQSTETSFNYKRTKLIDNISAS